MYSKPSQNGFTLVELLITTALGLLLLAALAGLLVHYVEIYQQQEVLQTLYDDAMQISRILQKELGQVGDLGCQVFSEKSQIQQDNSQSFFTNMGIKFYQVDSDALPAVFPKNDIKKLLPHSVVILTEHVSSLFSIAQYDPERGRFQILGSSIQKNDPVLLSSCKHAWLFRASKAYHQQEKLFLTAPFAVEEPDDAFEIAPWQSTLWFVMKNSGDDYGLYRLIVEQETTPVEFLSHVTAFQASVVLADGAEVNVNSDFHQTNFSLMRLKLGLEKDHMHLDWPISIVLMRKAVSWRLT